MKHAEIQQEQARSAINKIAFLYLTQGNRIKILRFGCYSFLREAGEGWDGGKRRWFE